MCSDKCEAIFLRLKELLTSPLTFTILVEGESFVIHYDAFHIGLGYVLMQQGQAIAYASH